MAPRCSRLPEQISRGRNLPPRFAGYLDDFELCPSSWNLIRIPEDLFNVPYGRTRSASFQSQTHVDLYTYNVWSPLPYMPTNYYSDASTIDSPLMIDDHVLFIDASTSPRTTQNHHQQMIDGHSIIDLDLLPENFSDVDFPNRNRGGPVLSEEAISKHMKTRAATRQDTTEICTVCQDYLHEQGKNESIATLDCGHGYHADCIKRWLRHKNVCPLCNAIALVVPDYNHLVL